MDSTTFYLVLAYIDTLTNDIEQGRILTVKSVRDRITLDREYGDGVEVMDEALKRIEAGIFANPDKGLAAGVWAAYKTLEAEGVAE